MKNLVTTDKLPKDCFSDMFCTIILYLQPFQILKLKKFIAAIFKFYLQNLSPLPMSLKAEPLAGLKFFVNTTKNETKAVAVFGRKPKTKVSTLSLSPG